ncbi:hypothetical protein, partial [Streptomyces sp. NPDC005859]
MRTITNRLAGRTRLLTALTGASVLVMTVVGLQPSSVTEQSTAHGARVASTASDTGWGVATP